MNPPERLKIAFIGSHGVGKTTLCYGLAARLKSRDVACEVVHEVARRCPLPINRETTQNAQGWILHTQIAEEMVAMARYPVVICDRSALDNYVYQLLASGPEPSWEAMVETWMSTYHLLVTVPIVGQPSPDGIRAADPTFQRAVDQRLAREVERRGLRTLSLDPGDRAGWLTVVERASLELLRPSQLSLLDDGAAGG